MKSSEVLRKVKKAGWYEIRWPGSHLIMAHKDFKYAITFTSHGSKEMATGSRQNFENRQDSNSSLVFPYIVIKIINFLRISSL